MTQKERYGRIAYDAYVDHTGGVSLVSGALLPPWVKLDPKIQEAWCASAAAVIKMYPSVASE